MRQLSAIRALLVLIVLAPSAIFAQSASSSSAVAVPRLINISGVFRPANGQPAGAVETVTLSIYADQQGGAPLWQETQVLALDAQGRYTLLLGATQADGIPAAVFNAGEAKWLGTAFDRPGEVEGPRVRLTSVPYALRASDAETLGGRPASAYLLAPSGGSTASQTAGISSEPSVAADAPSVTADAVLPGADNFLAKYVNGGTDVASSAIYESGARMGIGTSAPQDSLHIRFNDTTGAFTGFAVQNLGNTTASYSGTLFYDHLGDLGQFQGFNNSTHEYRINNIARVSPGGAFNGSINFMTGHTSRFFVGSNGTIGIGTTVPSALLDVSNGASTVPFATVTATTYVNTGQGSLFVGRKARGTAAAPAAVVNGDVLAGVLGRGHGATNFNGTGNGGMFVRAAENWTDTAQGTSIGFNTTSVGTTVPLTRMTLSSSGNLGIGTAIPSASVDAVREGAPADFRATSFSGGAFGGANSAYVTRTARGTFVAPSAVQLGDDLGAFGVTGYGATGFGEFAAGVGGFAAENWTDTAQGAALGLAATPLGSNEAQVNLVVLPGGNVGIGVFEDFPTVADKLHVFGDIRVGTTGTNGCLKNFGGTGLVGTCVSDRRFKRDITPFDQVLDKFAALQPVNYFWRAGEFPDRHFGNDETYGLIAQDVEETLPELVVTGADGFKAVDYSKLPLLTIQAVKELKEKNDALTERIADLERLVSELLAAAHR